MLDESLKMYAQLLISNVKNYGGSSRKKKKLFGPDADN